MTRSPQGVGSNQYQTRHRTSSASNPDERTAIRRAAVDLSAEEVAWAFHPDRPRWESTGYLSWSAVKDHIQAGRSPEASVWVDAEIVDPDWLTQGRTVAVVAPWALRGFSCRQWREWSSNSFTADQATEWRDAGFAPQSANRWFYDGYFQQASEARAWMDSGYGDSTSQVRAAAQARARGENPSPPRCESRTPEQTPG